MKNVRKTNEQFITESISIHGNSRYSYEKVEYINTNTKVKIFCFEHNEYFLVTPKRHINGQGCQLCAYKKYRSNGKMKTLESFIQKAIGIHGNLYDYSTSKYNGANEAINIKCNTCNVEFHQIASSHLQGSGCKTCSHERAMNNQRGNTESFIEKAKLKHGNLYSYDKTVYGKNNTEKVIVKCNTCGIEVKIRPSNFLSSSRPMCDCVKHRGFQENKPSIVYYLEISNGIAYKIGITNKSVEKRFNKCDLEKIKILKIWSFPNGADARDLETNILREYKDYLYKGDNLLKTGNSELFNVNILSL